MAEEIDWKQRYCWNYSDRVRATHRLWRLLAGGKCVCCMVNEAEEIHHTSYGSDSLGTNWFPVCKDCHKHRCHSPENWIKDKSDPLWRNRNTESFVRTLQKNYKFLSQGERSA